MSLKEANKNLKVLDCTLRDGGFALEDAKKNDIANDAFSETEKKQVAKYIKQSGIDIIEVGAIEDSAYDKSGYAIYPNVLDERLKVDSENSGLESAIFYRGPDISMDTIPDYKDGIVQIARVCIRYSEIQKSLDFCKGLKEKGYKVFVQPMVTERYTDSELELVLTEANDMGADAVYIVDSYGDFFSQDVIRLSEKYDEILKKRISVGFHGHNNIEMALMNTCTFIQCFKDRDIIIDSCCTGMGQGTGNLQTEVLINYLNSEYGTSYDILPILEVCELVGKFNKNQLWGYSALRFVPGVLDTAYKYAIALDRRYHMRMAEIYSLLKDIPEDLQYRFSEDNLKTLLEGTNYTK